ncbi:ribosome hibernation promotion factor [Saccharopolyspora erythraea]|uniref:HPF/RaiA family ribosome-associated protein n=1 Tax=Saccharopolyspora erythraea TaxID=1836 RepID=A0ABP3N2W4_SACER|nr:HPF/RaiA family ribosome-associated protein [Saccharopolyspora erythraea]EQD85004.1 ribosome-associated protein [Saccharopolyspora erythraea D]
MQVTDEPIIGIADYAEERVRSVFRFAHEPVLYARVRVSRHRDPAASPRAVAQASLDVNGRPVRAQVRAATSEEAIDRLHDRLQHVLERVARHWEARRGRMGSRQPHEWRHGDQPARRPPYFPRPVEESQVIRHKTFALARCGVDDAEFDMDVMDYDFHLFTEVGTGQDSVLYRTPSGFRLAQVEPDPGHLAEHALPVTVSEQRAPVLSTAEAVERMGAMDLPFLFYLDGERGRGALLYRRYDGHYGLITPSA